LECCISPVSLTCAFSRKTTRRAEEVSSEELRQARRGFEAKVRQYPPRSIAFLGKRAFSIMIGQPEVPWGRQAMSFAGTMSWILANPALIAASPSMLS
jgi:TDG/mug DNA glycosylase family protein